MFLLKGGILFGRSSVSQEHNIASDEIDRDVGQGIIAETNLYWLIEVQHVYSLGQSLKRLWLGRNTFVVP